MELLPRANVMLLRYLFGVLYSIEKQSEGNQMTAFNLAVCIAPSLLWPPAPASPGTEGEFTKRVSKHQFDSETFHGLECRKGL